MSTTVDILPCKREVPPGSNRRQARVGVRKKRTDRYRCSSMPRHRTTVPPTSGSTSNAPVRDAWTAHRDCPRARAVLLTARPGPLPRLPVRRAAVGSFSAPGPRPAGCLLSTRLSARATSPRAAGSACGTRCARRIDRGREDADAAARMLRHRRRGVRSSA